MHIWMFLTDCKDLDQPFFLVLKTMCLNGCNYWKRYWLQFVSVPALIGSIWILIWLSCYLNRGSLLHIQNGFLNDCQSSWIYQKLNVVECYKCVSACALKGQHFECHNKEKKVWGSDIYHMNCAQQLCLKKSDFKKSYGVRERLASPC